VNHSKRRNQSRKETTTCMEYIFFATSLLVFKVDKVIFFQ